MVASQEMKHAVAPFAQTKRAWGFFITYMIWTSVHAARKSYSAAKSDIMDAHWFRSSWYGEDQQAAMVALPDAVFFFVYTFGSFLGGIASDRYDVRIVLSTFLALSAVFLAAFGAAGFFGVHSFLLYVVLWGAQAFTQAFCWPGCIAIMGKWFTGRSRSTVMGSWTSASNIGNLLGTAVAAVAFEALSPPFTSPEDTGPGPSSAVAWSTLMVVLALLLLLVGLLVFATLVPDPSFVPLPTRQPLDEPLGDMTLARPLLAAPLSTSESPTSSTDTLDPDDRGAPLLPDPSDSPDKRGPTATGDPPGRHSHSHSYSHEEANGPLPLPPLPLPLPIAKKPLGLVDAMLLPGVLDVGLSYSAIKAVSYTLFWWLPTLLKVSFTLTAGRANLVVMLFDLGQMLGSVGGGYASSHSRRPVAVIFFMIAVLVLPLVGLEKLPNLHTTCVLILLAGIFSGGPHNLLATAVSQDLGQQQHPHADGGAGHPRVEAIATVASIVDAFGSLGAGIMQYLVGRLVTCKTDDDDRITSCDWRSVLIILAALTGVGGLCLSRMLFREAREPARRYSQ